MSLLLFFRVLELAQAREAGHIYLISDIICNFVNHSVPHLILDVFRSNSKESLRNIDFFVEGYALKQDGHQCLHQSLLPHIPDFKCKVFRRLCHEMLRPFFCLLFCKKIVDCPEALHELLCEFIFVFGPFGHHGIPKHQPFG